MQLFKKNWAVTLGIVLGVCVGVVVSKTMDRWNLPALADGREGKRAATAHSETFRYAAKVIQPAVVAITTTQRVKVRIAGQQFYNDQGLPFYRPPQIKEGMVPKGLGSGFIQFVAGEKGQRIILRSGMVPATMPIRLMQIKSE